MQKAQGALEYLLLIGGAILVAVIVISLIVGLSGSAGTEAQSGAADAQCAKYPESDCELHLVTAGQQEYLCELTTNSECRSKAATPITACDTIGNNIEAGKAYYLANDISDAFGAPLSCITINGKNNVTVNCLNRSITLTGSSNFGIALVGDNSTIVNCNMSITGTGIWLRGSDNTIKNNKIEATTESIKIVEATPNSANNIILNNTACGTGARKIWIDENNVPQSSASVSNTCDDCLDDYGVLPFCIGTTCPTTCS